MFYPQYTIIIGIIFALNRKIYVCSIQFGCIRAEWIVWRYGINRIDALKRNVGWNEK